MLFPIFFEGTICQQDIADLFTAAGYCVRVDSAGRMVASRVPAFLKRDSDNVLRLPGRTGRKVAR